MKNIYYLLFTISFVFLAYFLHPIQTKVMYVRPKDKREEISVQKAQEEFHNKEIIGYIKIPQTQINHFVVRTDNNDFYLHHNLRKEKSIFGSVFMDYRNSKNDNQINIYGHSGNHKNSPFYDLNQYKNKSFFQSHKTIIFHVEQEKRLYDIVYVIITQEEFHMDLSKNNKEKKDFYEKNLLYETHLSIDKSDSLLVLQTCTYEKENAFLLIIAKERKE